MDTLDVASEHSYGEMASPNSSSHKNQVDKEKEKDGSNEEICPFVCGICSKKFDKISPFYAHLKTHNDFENLQTSKNEVLKALNVHDKVDENIFKCGVCQIEFPSMSLLHDHMVLEENISDYHYSNVDHTARPNKKVYNVTVSKVSTAKSSGSSFSGNSNSKRKRSLVTDSELGSKKKRSDEESIEESSDENGKRKVKAEEQVQSSPGSKSKYTKKAKASQQSIMKSEVPQGISSPSTRSSSRSGSAKRVDYKALAGMGSPKSDTEYDKIVRVKENKDNPVLNLAKKNVNKSTGMEMTDDENKSETEDKDTDQTRDIPKKSERPQRVSTRIQKQEDDDQTKSGENVEESTDDTDKSSESGAESNGKNNGTDADGCKEDGTHETGGLNDEAPIKAEIDDDDEDFQDDNDSDDDFGDFQDEDDDYDPLIELGDKKEYLRRHGLKTKQQVKIRGRNVVKNCLYPCSVCGKYFNWKALRKHSFAHISKKEVECLQCGKKYKSKRHLGDHMRSVHTMSKYQCGFCGDFLKGKQGFEKHATLHVLRKDVTGSIDDIPMIEVTDQQYEEWKEKNGKRVAFKKKRAPIIVAKSISGEDSVVDLNDGPIHGEQLELDVGLVGKSTNLDCKVCSKHFQNHDSLMTHLLEHKKEKCYQCESCLAYFQTDKHLENHISEVHGQSIHECGICGERFRNLYAMWSHKGIHLKKTDKYYSEEIVEQLQAEIAARKAARKKTLLKKPTEKKTEVCEICGAIVLTSRMKRHLEVHKDTKEWECDICHKFYKTRRYLVDHKKKTHFAETSTCDICGQNFRGKAYLEIHKQIHGPRDKKCPYCDKGFTTMMYLRAHLTTHQEKKQYKCSMCPAAFSHKQRRHIHMLEIHKQGENRPCKYCGEMFPSREKARKHERRIHEGIRYTRNRSGVGNDGEVNVLQIDLPDGLSNSDKKIIQFVPPKQSSNITTIKIPSENTSGNINRNIPHVVQNDLTSAEGQFIKLENGDEYRLMLEGEDGEEPLEVIELSEEQHNVFIQETTEATEAIATQSVEGEDNVEQVLEIPENAEQCQILLFPDGSFKLLNVVDNTAPS